jgi:peptidoglycan/xylan/chitin deacetylase (PgdA/CDA1 family)
MKLFKKSKKNNLFKNVSPFAAICAIVAIGYIGWRLFTFVGPGGLGMAFASTPKPVELGCSQDVDGEITASGNLPLVSTSYQQYLQRQKATGPNLVQNYSLEAMDEDNQPTGYFHAAETDYLVYSFGREATNKVPFLRVETTHKLGDKEQPGSWITDSLRVESGATYAYGFAYRSNVPITVSLEYTMPDGSLQYAVITKLDSQENWQTFTHYFTNQNNATSARVIATSSDAGQIDTRNYDLHRIADAQLDAGLVSVTFDDGWQSVADHAIPLLNQQGIKTTQYVISEASDKHVAQYMDVETLQRLKSQGHEIGSHTEQHCDQTKLSNEEILANARDSKNTLEKDGLGPISSFAYPYGRYDDNTQPLVARAYEYMRSSDVGYNDRYFDSRNIKSMVVLNDTTDAEFKSWLDYAKQNHLWLVIAYHRVDETGQYSVTTAQLKRQLQLIKDSRLEVKTLSAAANDIR